MVSVSPAVLFEDDLQSFSWCLLRGCLHSSALLLPEVLEAVPGVEPEVAVLQTAALSASPHCRGSGGGIRTSVAGSKARRPTVGRPRNRKSNRTIARRPHGING